MRTSCVACYSGYSWNSDQNKCVPCTEKCLNY